MKEYTTNLIRNIALAGHLSAGKTMLAEAFLHFSGATTRLGRIEDGLDLHVQGGDAVGIAPVKLPGRVVEDARLDLFSDLEKLHHFPPKAL